MRFIACYPPRGAVAVAALAAAIVLAPAAPHAETIGGTIEKVENDGRSVTIAGKAIAISGSRSNICIKGVCDQPRSSLKPGLTCEADVAPRNGVPEARKLSCK